MSEILLAISELAAELTKRGTDVRPPAKKQALSDLEDALGSSLSDQARDWFSIFDGFETGKYDNLTMVYLWSVDEIKTQIKVGEELGDLQVIGDYLIASDLLLCDLRSDFSKIWWKERRCVAAKNLLDFCRRMADGTFRP